MSFEWIDSGIYDGI